MASYPEEPCLSTPLTAINKYNKLILQIQIKERKKYCFLSHTLKRPIHIGTL